MSSSNLVSVIYTDPEAVYGQSPDPSTGIPVKTARFVSETLSGTPTTTESAAIRSDRMSGGMVTTGLEVGGDLNFELASDDFFDDFFEMGMMSAWMAETTPVAATFTPDVVDPQKGVLAGTGIGIGINVNDVIRLVDGSGVVTLYTVIEVTSDDELLVASARDQPATSGDASRPGYLDIGADVTSRTISKAYRDVTHEASADEHSQRYSGSVVSGFSVDAQYGAIVTGLFSTMGNGYEQEYPSMEQKVLAGGGSVAPAGTTNPLNASVDVPVVTSDGEATNFCIESFNITLDNGLTPQNCIGTIAPKKYELGTAAISITASIYLGDQSYDRFMPQKLTQEPISMTFVMSNLEGGFAFHLPAIQLSFPDPSAGGANTPVMIDASGSAKVGDLGASALRIYKL